MEDTKLEVLRLDLQKAVDLFAQARQIRGDDFNYVEHFAARCTCKYVEMDESGHDVPGCAVGHSLILGGIPIEVLAEEGTNDSMDSEELLDHLERKGLLTWDAPASDYLQEVQKAQDAGKSWVNAHEHAIRIVSYAYPDEVGELRLDW